MCVQVKVNDVWCDTMSELRAIVGDAFTTNQDYYWVEPDDECCLCCCDVESTAAKAGYDARLNEVFDWILTKENTDGEA